MLCGRICRAQNENVSPTMMRTKQMNMHVNDGQQQGDWSQGNRIMPDQGINSRYTDQVNT